MKKKSKFEFNIKLFRKVLINEDYNEFLEIVNGKEEDIKNIDVASIINFNHDNKDFSNDLLIRVYQYLKYYLQEKNLYSEKFQEGLSLCASKAILISEFSPSTIENYVTVGERLNNQFNNNPFEEIIRVLLVALKDEKYLDYDQTMECYFGNKFIEPKLFFNILMKAFNEKKLNDVVTRLYTGNIIEEICADLENSNINSSSPISATTKDNKEVLIHQFERIENLYTNKLEYCILLGIVPNNSFANKLMKRFNNKVVLSKRNIGVYEQTKQLIK